jgi:hypothetical protein
MKIFGQKLNLLTVWNEMRLVSGALVLLVNLLIVILKTTHVCGKCLSDLRCRCSRKKNQWHSARLAHVLVFFSVFQIVGTIWYSGLTHVCREISAEMGHRSMLHWPATVLICGRGSNPSFVLAPLWHYSMRRDSSQRIRLFPRTVSDRKIELAQITTPCPPA